MDAASAPTSAVTLPPPGVGCLAAAALRNSPTGVFRPIGRLAESLCVMGSSLRAPRVVLDTPGREIYGWKRRIGSRSFFNLYFVRIRRADGNHTFLQSAGRELSNVVQRDATDPI